MYYVTTSITQGICLTTHHTQKMHAYIHVLVWYSIRINEMGFDDAYIKKNMLLKNIYRKVHVARYMNLPKWTLPFKCVHPSVLNNVTSYWIYIYVSHFIRDLPGLRLISDDTVYPYISCAHGWFDSRYASYIILSLII